MILLFPGLEYLLTLLIWLYTFVTQIQLFSWFATDENHHEYHLLESGLCASLKDINNESEYDEYDLLEAGFMHGRPDDTDIGVNINRQNALTDVQNDGAAVSAEDRIYSSDADVTSNPTTYTNNSLIVTDLDLHVPSSSYASEDIVLLSPYVSDNIMLLSSCTPEIESFERKNVTEGIVYQSRNR